MNQKNGVGILIIGKYTTANWKIRGKYTMVIGRFENDERAPSNSMKIVLDDYYTNRPVKSVFLRECRLDETG